MVLLSKPCSSAPLHQCEPGLGAAVMYDLLYNQPYRILMLLGGCSTVSTTIGEAAKMWNLIVVRSTQPA